MSKIKNYVRSRRWLRYLLIGALIVLTVGGVLGGAIALSRNTDKIDTALTYKAVGTTKYSIGGLDGNGNYMNTDKSIYTKKAFECQGLNVTLAFDSNVTYEIFFYDQNNDFVHTTGRLTGSFVQDSVPFFAKYARIVITPKDDNKVTIFEVVKYAKQLKTSVYREQGFKNYTENLLTAEYLNKIYSQGNIIDDDRYCLSNYVTFSSYNEALLLRLESLINLDNTAIIVLDSDRNFIRWSKIGDLASESFVTSTGEKYYRVAFDDSFFAGAKFIQVSFDPEYPVGLFCR